MKGKSVSHDALFPDGVNVEEAACHDLRTLFYISLRRAIQV